MRLHILSEAKVNAEFLGNAAAFLDVDAGKADNRGGDGRDVFFRLADEVENGGVGFRAEGGAADALVAFGIRGVEGDGDGVHQFCQFGKDVATVDEIGLAVGIDPHPDRFLFKPPGNLRDQIEAQQRFAVAAEDYLMISGGIADGPFDLGGVRLVVEFEGVPLDGEVAEFGAEGTGVGAAVGDIEVERVADAVGDLG